MEKRYQVFVSSTFADLEEERSKVIHALMQLDCIPAGMELFPAADEEQFQFIKSVIDYCDYYLLIIGGRYGSMSNTGMSFTEQEYQYAIERGLPVIALLHQHPETLPLEKSEQTPELRERLKQFRERVSKGRLVKFWNSTNELPGLVALSVQHAIKRYPSVGWIRGSQASNRPLVPHNGELASYIELHEDPLLFEPFREDLKAEVTYERVGRSEFLVRDKVSYVCKSVNNRISSHLLWQSDPGEFIEIPSIRIDVKPPANHAKAGKRITLFEGAFDKVTSMTNGAKVELEIPDEFAVDGLRVTYDSQYLMNAVGINVWYMGAVTRGFALTMTYPKDLLVSPKPFVPLHEAGNLTVDRPGYFNYRYDEWLMPNDGLAWAFTKLPDKK